MSDQHCGDPSADRAQMFKTLAEAYVPKILKVAPKPGDILVLKVEAPTYNWRLVRALAQELRNNPCVPEDVTLIMLGPSQTLEQLHEPDMNRLGWYRASSLGATALRIRQTPDFKEVGDGIYVGVEQRDWEDFCREVDNFHGDHAQNSSGGVSESDQEG